MKQASRSFRTSAMLLAAAAAWSLALTGCGGPSRAIDPQAQADIAKKPPAAAPEAKDFPSIDSAVWKQGAFPSIEALNMMRTGMGKDQVRELLSWPHFNTGVFGGKEWNYIFHFRTGPGSEYKTCQYMVRFNDASLTTGMYWKDPQCADFLKKPAPQVVVMPAAPVPAPVVAAAPIPPAPQKRTLAADGLFRFAGGGMNDLRPEGRRQVEALAAELKGMQIQWVQITGHADRLGSAAGNLALSQKRAETVRDLLVQQGIDGRLIRVAGMGSQKPVAQCPGKARSPALVQCLEPNRRVEIEVMALH